LIASSLELLHIVLFRKKPPKISRYILDSATRNYRYDCSKAARDLGWDAEKAIEM
jgi:hypothetical protein